MTSSAGIGSETEPSAPSVPEASAANVLGASVVHVLGENAVTAPADPPPTALVETGRSVLAEIVTIVPVVTERIDPRDAMTSQTKERGNASKKGVRRAPLLHEMDTDAPSAPLRLAPRASLVKNVRGCGQTTASSTETKKGESVPAPAASSTYRPSAAKARTRIKTSLIKRPPIAYDTVSAVALLGDVLGEEGA